jgi:cytochrome c peroxidase
MNKILMSIGLISALVSCSNENNSIHKEGTKENIYLEAFPDLLITAQGVFSILPSEALNPKNESTVEKIALGKKLYFDTRLSKDNTQSCNTCHNLETYGVDNKSFSEGNDGGLGGRNSPTTLNAALHISQFWDGREPDVEAQAGGPILNPIEMAMHSEKEVMVRLAVIEEYQLLFKEAFPNSENLFTYDNLKKAIGVFERELLTPSKFDEYLNGDLTALSDDEKEGLNTFIGEGCIACHSGPLLGGTMFNKFGLFGEYWKLTNSEKIDNGKFDITQIESDRYVFKVPSLRNVEKTYPYFHDGSVNDLTESVRIMAKLQLGKELSDEKAKSIVQFLNTLTGEVRQELRE